MMIEESNVKYQLHVHQTCLVYRSFTFPLGSAQTWELTVISPAPYQFFFHFMVQGVKLRAHVHFSWSLQIPSIPFHSAEVCGGVGQEKKFYSSSFPVQAIIDLLSILLFDAI